MVPTMPISTPQPLSPDIEDARPGLLRNGIVVLDEFLHGNRTISVAGPGEERSIAVVTEILGNVEVDWVGTSSRMLLPRPCYRCREREPSQLQLRVILAGEEHVDQIHVAEDAESVVVLVTVCCALVGERGERMDVPCNVWLDEPLGDRVVVDGSRGAPIDLFVPDV